MIWVAHKVRMRKKIQRKGHASVLQITITITITITIIFGFIPFIPTSCTHPKILVFIHFAKKKKKRKGKINIYKKAINNAN